MLNIQKRILQVFGFFKPKSPPHKFPPPYLYLLITCSRSPLTGGGTVPPHEDIVFGKPCRMFIIFSRRDLFLEDVIVIAEESSIFTRRTHLTLKVPFRKTNLVTNSALYVSICCVRNSLPDTDTVFFLFFFSYRTLYSQTSL